MKKIYLTKKRKEELHTALSIDDILYEKYRRMMEHLQREEARIGRKRSIARIIREEKGVMYDMQITNTRGTDEGLIVFVK